MSRWFVGSSRSSRSGSAITSRASVARVCSPPDSAVGGCAHSSRVEPEAGQRLVDALVERCSRRGPRTRAGGRRSAALLDATAPARSSASRPPSPRGAPRRARTAARRSGAAMNAASKCDSWASRPIVSPRFRWTSPPSGSSRPAAIRSSVVLPAPFGPTSPMRSPTAIAAVIVVEDDERPDLAADAARGAGSTPLSPRPRRAPPPGGSRRPAGSARSAPSGAPSASASRAGPTLPSPPGSSVQRRPAPLRRRHRARGSRRAPARSRGRQALAPRAEVGRPPADDDPPDRPAAAQARLAGPLVDREVLLHLAVAVGRRVVVDRRAAPDHRLGEDPPELRSRGAARRAGAASGPSGADGGAPPRAPRRRRCCRRRRRTSGRAAAA